MMPHRTLRQTQSSHDEAIEQVQSRLQTTTEQSPEKRVQHSSDPDFVFFNLPHFFLRLIRDI